MGVEHSQLYFSKRGAGREKKPSALSAKGEYFVEKVKRLTEILIGL